MEITTTTPIQKDDLIEKLLKEKEVAFNFQKRRHEDWTDNYELYRNKIKTNRLTQRQAVAIPLMKETLKVILAKIDDPPSVKFKDLGGDRQKEIYLQELWESDFNRLNYEGIDVLDKKTILLYGRGFKKLNFLDEQFKVDALDIYDVIVDPLVSPIDLETARFVIHQNIFKSVKEILADDKYTGKKNLEAYIHTKEGLIQSEKNKEALEKKQERLESMGVEKTDFEKFPGGDLLVNLSEHYTWLWDSKAEKFVRYVIIYADDKIRLLKEPLKDLIGVDFLPFVSWGDDVETQDFWSDGVADLVRVPNKILNIFFSQMIENRTLKNFQMHWYDSTKQGYIPQTYEPGPGRMLPAPGNPRDVILPVEISGLEDTLTQIDFLIKLIERGTSATAIEKGVSEKKQITLGEVEMLVGKAMEQTMSTAKFYRRSWKELAEKWYKIKEANSVKQKTIYKVSGRGNIWPMTVKVSDWKSEKGYRVEVKSTSEQEAEKTSGIQKMMVVKQQFPDNPALHKIVQRRILELIDLTPDELREVEEYEEKKTQGTEGTEMSQLTNGVNELSQMATTLL